MKKETKSAYYSSEEFSSFPNALIGNPGFLVFWIPGQARNDGEGLKTAKKEKHFKKRCPTFVQDAAEILEEILEHKQQSKGKGER